MHILPSASLIRRSAFEAAGGFDEQLSGYEDDDLFLRLFCATWRKVYLAESLSFWRMTEASCSLTPRMAKSRMLYARKLLAGFPDQRQRRIYFARDLIAPRFMRSCLANFAAALEHRDTDLFRMALDHLAELAPHLSIRRRAIMLAILAAARIGAMHLAYSSRDYIRPIAARVMR
jgi:GT2 family glycosyltransferase